jgi:hypothetical protein
MSGSQARLKPMDNRFSAIALLTTEREGYIALGCDALRMKPQPSSVQDTRNAPQIEIE